MNARPRLGPAQEIVPREWHAVTYAFMGRREVVLDSKGEPLMFANPGPAAAVASGHKGGSSLFIRRSSLPPSVEEIREVANPPRTPCPSVSFDIEAMDGYGAPQQRSSFDAWGR